MLRSVLQPLSLLIQCISRQQRSLLYKASKKVLVNVVMSVTWTAVRADNVKSLCVVLESTVAINNEFNLRRFTDHGRFGYCVIPGVLISP